MIRWFSLLFAFSIAAIIGWYVSTATAVQITHHIKLHRPGPEPRVGVIDTIKYDVSPPYVPPPPVSPSPSAGPIAAPSGGCPASLAGESTSPTAVNASSGASGCIQALPETWAAYGDPAYASAADAPVSVQMQAMARICAAQGNGAWVAADPC